LLQRNQKLAVENNGPAIMRIRGCSRNFEETRTKSPLVSGHSFGGCAQRYLSLRSKTFLSSATSPTPNSHAKTP
jgi:hypothetical protein